MTADSDAMAPADATATQQTAATTLMAGALACLVLVGWRLWLELWEVWQQPDYSHAFLIPLIIPGLLWWRADLLPRTVKSSWWPAPAAIASMAAVVLGIRLNLDPLAFVGAIGWLAAAALMIWGGRGGLRLLPFIALTVFVFPLPFRLDQLVTGPLRALATDAALWILHLLGQPARTQGTIIELAGHHLEVARACSGLRMMMSFLVVGAICAFVTRQGLVWKTLLLLVAVPIAVICNVLRIVMTALLYRYRPSLAEPFHDDWAGVTMILVALLLLAGWQWFSSRLVVEIRPIAAVGVRP